ncbi:MAG: hypothetical protein AAB561_00765 [Patescibacteria group bacterium]
MERFEYKQSEQKEALPEKGSDIKEAIDRIMASRANDLDRKVELVREHLKTKSPELQNRYGGRIISFLKKASRGMGIACLLSVAGLYGNYERTRYTVQEKSDPDGSVGFVHEDQETTDVINLMTGSSELSSAFKLKVARDVAKSLFRGRLEINLPPEIDSVGEKEFNNLLVKVISAHKESLIADGGLLGIDLVNAVGRGEDFVGFLISMQYGGKHKKEIYEILWRLERECGNPKIRLVSRGDKHYLVFKGSKANQFRASYHPMSNIIYLSLDKAGNGPLSDDFIAELSHGKQFSETPVTSSLVGIKDWIGVFGSSLYNQQDIDTSYNELYDQEGSLEHEAHGVIEPKLRDKVLDRVIDRVIENNPQLVVQSRKGDSKALRDLKFKIQLIKPMGGKELDRILKDKLALKNHA